MTWQGGKDEYKLYSWNPRREQVFLRYVYSEKNPGLEVFDLLRQKVLASFRASPEEVVWSSDGRWLIISRGDSLVFQPTPGSS